MRIKKKSAGGGGRLIILILCFSLCWRCHSKDKNHLANASSPYLRACIDNPVNWYEWGKEALLRAKTENKPLLVSIGYAACHWCHQMEKESFMDSTVAKIMNENFVCIKVDREERPDLDNFYATACQLISGGSGWPLHAFTLPDGKPFFAGTYYSKQSWISLLKQVSSAYKTQHYKVELQAQGIANGIWGHELSLVTNNANQAFSKNTYRQLFDSIRPTLDINNGGSARTPKFPNPYVTEFLLQYYFLTNNRAALTAATTTLTKMACGGIYDQVAGGFARYAADSLWRVPHFEKMLYDNAQLLSLYAHAYQLTKDNFYKTIVRETAACIQRDFRSAQGGYYSSLDADTKEGEGVFYSWNKAGLQRWVAGNQNLLEYYNITENGNWKNGQNILYASSTPLSYAENKNIDPDEFQSDLSSFKELLLKERSKRNTPSVDKKILVSWNALTIIGWIDAYAALGDSSYLQYALANAVFIEKNMLQNDGKLWRSFIEDKPAIPAFLEDYAFLCEAFIQLYQITFDRHWLMLSKKIADQSVKKFYDAKSMFFFGSDKTESKIEQTISLSDNSIPSANAVMARALYSLGIYFQDDGYQSKSRNMQSRLNHLSTGNNAVFYSSWCFLNGLYAYGTNEVVIVGPDAVRKNTVLRKNYLPQAIIMGSTGSENLPLLVGRKNGDKTFIYVCTNSTCKKPVQSEEDALLQLKTSLIH